MRTAIRRPDKSQREMLLKTTVKGNATGLFFSTCEHTAGEKLERLMSNGRGSIFPGGKRASF